MSLMKLFESEFPGTIKERGFRYFKSQRVSLTKQTKNRVEFQVRGTSNYKVRFDTKNHRTIAVFCSCPYAEDHAFCKHIWASILTLNKNGGSFYQALGHSPSLRFSKVSERFDEAVAFREQRATISTTSKMIDPKGWNHHLLTSEYPQVPDWQNFLQQINRLPLGNIRPVVEVFQSHELQEVYFGLMVDRQDILQVRFFQVDANKNLRSLYLPRNIELMAGFSDRALLGQILASRLIDLDYFDPSPQLSEVTIEPVFAVQVFQDLAHTKRLYLIDNRCSSIKDLQPLVWAEDENWQVEIALERSPPGGGRTAYRLSACFKHHEEAIGLDSLRFIQNDGIAVFDDKIMRLPESNRSQVPLIRYLKQNGPVPIYARDLDKFMVEYHQGLSCPPLHLPVDVKWRYDSDLDPVVRVVIRNPKAIRRQGDLIGELKFDYGEWVSFSFGEGKMVDSILRERLLVRRQLSKEASLVQLLANENLNVKESGELSIPIEKLSELCQVFFKRGWIIEAEGRALRSVSGFGARLESSGIDWFELDAQADYDGNLVDLPRLLRAKDEGQSLILLDDGTFGLLPEEWLERFATVARFGRRSAPDSGRLKFHRSQGLFLNSLAEDMEVDFGFQQFREKLESFRGIQPVKPSSKFRGDLRDYQMDGLAWLNFLREFGLGGCLADDMGLGKTVQVLAMLQTYADERREAMPSLIVLPKTLIYNWRQEALRFTPNLRVLVLEGSDRHAKREKFNSYDLILVTYGVLRRDYPLLQECRFAYVILDEAQAIKNFRTETAIAARSLQAEHRLALSGTPVENHLGELGSIFEFLNPGLLGSKGVQDLSRTSRASDLEPIIHSLRPLIFRRTKEQVLTDLPDKLEQTLYCELSGTQKKEYAQLRDFYRASLKDKIAQQGLERSSMHVLEALLRLRQAACHPGLMDPKRSSGASGKLDLLISMLDELTESGHKALVFSQFTKLLAIVRGHLERRGISYEYLDGKTRKREEKVQRFQSDKQCKVFLISLKAGGVGLNLTAADYCFILDPWWNPAVEAQAIDRIYRIGQEKQVFAYRLIAKDTVEEKILELQKKKKELSDAIVSAEGGFLRLMTAEDLELLLS